jgi:hypothetical protein
MELRADFDPADHASATPLRAKLGMSTIALMR